MAPPADASNQEVPARNATHSDGGGQTGRVENRTGASLLRTGARVALLGILITVAARPPDRTHPYGHGKAEPIAALVVAICVLAAAIGLAIESVREILMPHHGPAPFTLVILVMVIVIKEFLFRYVNRIGRDLESTAVQTDAWHHRSDALTSAAAFIGISLALIGGQR